jgi:carboxylesterase type B
MDQIKLNAGAISNAKACQRGHNTCIWSRIPYAAPSIGDLRWKPPLPAATLAFRS